MKRKWLAIGIILLFVCGALLPACNAQTNILQTDEEKMFLESPVKKEKHTNNYDESFFAFALIWGTFEINQCAGPFLGFDISNRGPWFNRTINVIGYVGYEHKFVYKQASSVQAYRYIGIVGLHKCFAFGFRDVTAF